ncbi:MAG: erythromycin esterase family protein [Marinifilaceae bacterium]|jgi:erythromycin esterase-like protein|nr:erythromycin esterase family protein [Marinifilaceae bacterium]
MKKLIKLLLVLLYGCTFISCNCEETRVLVNNTRQINSISPNDSVYTDLSFLKDNLKGNKIVLLGESGHGDGGTFKAKTRLVKYLHSELGYDVIAFEGSTMFNLFDLKQRLSDNCENLERIIKNRIFPNWSYSNEFKEMTHYLIHNRHCLDVIGIDNNFAVNSNSTKFIQHILSKYNLKSSQHLDIKMFNDTYKRIIRSTRQSIKLQDCDLFIEQLSILINMIKASNKEITSGDKLILQELSNLNSFIQELKVDLDESVYYRDIQMAKNLIWYIENLYPNKKVIVWTANLHASKNLNQVIYKNNDDRYQKLQTLADNLVSKFGDDKIYSIATTSVSGNTMTYEGSKEIEISKTSWDYRISKMINYDYAFVDFKNIRKYKNIPTSFESTILGYHSHIGKWYNVYDGLFFIRTMESSTY